MAWSEVFTCNGCGKQKQKVNRWWLASLNGGTFQIQPWTDEEANSAQQHLCGESCLTKAVSKYMQTKKGD